jgi:acetylglutamate kinase
MARPTVLKLGGELLDETADIRAAAQSIVRLAKCEPLVVVHGGGRAVDRELRACGAAPRFVDGVRITDQAALDVVVSVLAGKTNTSLVAAVAAAGGRAIGVTGADGLIGLCRRAPVFQTVSGERVDLGLVGEPESTDVTLLRDLLGLGWIPIACSIGVDRTGALLNVNADAMAAHLAGALAARRLVIAGTTAGVLDQNGTCLAELAIDEIERMAAAGAAHSGMVAKLNACRRAVMAGVEEVSIVSGRSTTDTTEMAGTRIVPAGTTLSLMCSARCVRAAFTE